MEQKEKVTEEKVEEKKAPVEEHCEPKAPASIDPAVTPGNYVILTEANNRKQTFAVFNGTVKILPMAALGGAFELK